MRTFHQIAEMRAHLRAARDEGLTIGFIPTMGALHEGHLSLIRRSVAECDRTVVSVFVNPTQFGPNEDLAHYPRDLQRDSSLCQRERVDAMFVPTPEEMYPQGFETTIQAPALSANYEGTARPGHFAGVATICAKLFNIVQPHRAYFGLKDYQQLRVVHRVVQDLNMPLSVVPSPTVREADGLAMSSRNAYLSPDERRAAPALYRALSAAAQRYEAGERSAVEIVGCAESVLASEPLMRPEYVAVADPTTLEPRHQLVGGEVILAAVRLGRTRLIDNVVLGSAPSRTSQAA